MTHLHLPEQLAKSQSGAHVVRCQPSQLSHWASGFRSDPGGGARIPLVLTQNTDHKEDYSNYKELRFGNDPEATAV